MTGLMRSPVAPALAQALELLLGPLAHEHVDVPFALEQPLDEMAADEAGGSRDEVAHPVSPSDSGPWRNLLLQRTRTTHALGVAERVREARVAAQLHAEA